MINKLVGTFDEAVADMQHGATVHFGGFASPFNSPSYLVAAVARQGASALVAISTSTGRGIAWRHQQSNWLPPELQPRDFFDLGLLAELGRLRRAVTTFAVGARHDWIYPFEERLLKGEVEVEVLGQGSLAERIRCAKAGIAAFYTPVGPGTPVAEGKEVRDFNGVPHVLETALHADFALIRAYKADRYGNLIFRGPRTFNETMAGAARVTHRRGRRGRAIGRAAARADPHAGRLCPARCRAPRHTGHHVGDASMSEPERLDPGVMAMIVAREFKDGDVINLGVGLPLQCANFVPPGIEILLHSELGLLGFGEVITDIEEADPYVMMVGNLPVRALPGMVFMSHDESFAMIRGGHIDIAVLGALQVDRHGNLANTQFEGKPAGNLGGAPDLAYGAKRTIVVMHHNTNTGEPKVVERCTLPLTAPACVTRMVTDVGVFDIGGGEITLREVAPGWTPEAIQAVTGARITVAPNVGEVTL